MTDQMNDFPSTADELLDRIERAKAFLKHDVARTRMGQYVNVDAMLDLWDILEGRVSTSA